MNRCNINLKKILIFFILLFFSNNIIANAAEEKIDAIVDQLQIITEDLKTLEKAVYKTAEITNRTSSNLENIDLYLYLNQNFSFHLFRYSYNHRNFAKYIQGIVL